MKTNAQIDELGCDPGFGPGYHDVGGLDVAVDNVHVFVEPGQTAQHAHSDTESLFFRKGFASGKQCLEILSNLVDERKRIGIPPSSV